MYTTYNGCSNDIAAPPPSPSPAWWRLRGQTSLILITLDRWKRHFQEKNYIDNYFYSLKSTKTTSQKCGTNIIWVDFFGRPYHINGIKTHLGSPVIVKF